MLSKVSQPFHSNLPLKTMKSTLAKYALVTMTSLSFSGWAMAATISFPDQATLDAAFPTVNSSGMTDGPTATSGTAVLLAGDLSLLNVNRQGMLSIYSGTSYSSGLDFITTGGLELTFNDAVFGTPRGTTWGKLGVVSGTTGAMSAADGVYLTFNRASSSSNNSVVLSQSVNGTESTLATLISGNVGGMFNSDTITLTLTATTWNVSLVLASSNTYNASGSFGTAWTTNPASWGTNTYLGLEAYQQNTTADANTRYGQLSVGSIDFQTIPEPAIAGLLLGAAGLLLGYQRRRKA